MADPVSNGNMLNYIPSEQLKNIVYVIDKIGWLSVVVLFLLGQNAGWVPSMAQSDHKNINSKIDFVVKRVDGNGERIVSTELTALRTQQIALQVCTQMYPKEDQYKCLKPYEK